MADILAQLQASLADRYAVERLLGEGGMAIVFLARDAKHDREVAIKVLKPELAASLGADRFLREIQVTAKLQHPHILPLYDSGDAGGLLYYVMPYVVGESLSDLLAREKQLGLEDAARITREVAEALAYAHSYGLVHRDIKPDNVMMSNGHAIVADFGIARALSEAGADKLTQTGMSVGTPAYMSPEQAAGDPGVDGRTDVYSLGCMLYEMLVGQVPFTGPTAMAIMARHTMDHVTPPSIMRQSIPPELEDIVLRAMEKVPADRYRTAHEMVEALKAVERGEVTGPRASTAMRASRVGARASQMGVRASQIGVALPEPPVARRRWPYVAGIGGAAAVVLALVGWQVFARGGPPPDLGAGGLDPRQVAVLYFEDLSRDSALGYVADGVTDGLIEELARVQGLAVISRNGVTPYRGTDLPRDSVARALNAGSLVLGSVEPAGDRLRVSARLVDGASGADVERASFEVPAANVLAARDSAVQTVSRFLRRRLGEEVRVRELRAGTGSVEAWSLLQRAERARRAGGAGLTAADSLLRLAEVADPRWPAPTLARGWVAYERARTARGEAALPWIAAGVRSAEQVLAADPNSARALELRGTLRFYEYGLQLASSAQERDRLLRDAQEDLQAAIGLDPGLASAHLTLSLLYYFTDDVPSALISARRAYEADAYLERADDVLDRLFWGSVDQEQFGQAERWCSEGRRRFPTDARFVLCRLWLLATPGPVPNATEAWTLVAALDSLRVPAMLKAQGRFLAGGTVARAGLADSARRVMDQTRAGVTAAVDPNQELLAVEAYVRTLAGQPDAAIDLLKRAVAANPGHDFAAVANRAWWWRDLRQHPRFKEITGGR